MALSTLSGRFNNEQYKNWVKLGHCLLILRDGLSSFISIESQQHYKQIMKGDNVLHEAATCKARNIVFRNEKYSLDPPCPTCDQRIDKIWKDFRPGMTRPYWTNSNLRKWSNNGHREVAKTYMSNSGKHKSHNGPLECDSAAILSYMKSCKHFERLLGGKSMSHVDNVSKSLVVRYKHSILYKKVQRFHNKV